MEYRKLTLDEIAQLGRQNCRAQNWTLIEVPVDFIPQYIHQTHFSGQIRLGKFQKTFMLPGGVPKHSGISNATLHNCEIGDNVLIENVHGAIANYRIGANTHIQNVGSLVADGQSSFGNGVKVTVLNEAGGMEIKIQDQLSAPVAYMLAIFRHRPSFLEKMEAMIDHYVQQQMSVYGEIGRDVQILHTTSIKNVKIGNSARIEGAARLENGSINSNEHDPVFIGHQVIAEDFIISSGACVDSGAILSRCFVGQTCHLGRSFSAMDSLFFSNCHAENGEAVSVFAGPFTATHHKSTLLIAGMFSFLNAGSGSNQSNHRYKSGPVHYGIFERGVKLASDSYVLYPARIGAFSLVMGRHYQSPDTSDFPFSYLIEEKEETLLIPGVNLKTVGLARDAEKFPKRDCRKDPHLLDPIRFEVLTPYTVQKMLRGIEISKEFQNQNGTPEFYVYSGCKIPASAVQKGIDLYSLAIRKYLGEITGNQTDKSFLNQTESSSWMDLSGLILPQSQVEKFIEAIETGQISTIAKMHEMLAGFHQNYACYEWNFIRNIKGLSDHWEQIIADGKSAAAILAQEIQKDREKENQLIKKSYGNTSF
ncbi:MAG: DUF4954 family protein [Dysgonamonadaceae bacterium]|jgi:carbonic anhydrase/acetyltransferase-like protein (isoleucine patch superfamily)|nr:DUF4954 family protein [Dysgonamonadaceae bacterium]